jgi:glucan phosphoethanolaminetransferase (alkaline phosphatase superfamily)
MKDIMHFFLFSISFLASLYCLADLFLSLRFKIRLKPSHLVLLSRPGSFWSSGKWLILPFFIVSITLWYLPILTFILILCAKWPHPFLLAYREKRRREKPASSFPSCPIPNLGPQLFKIAANDRPHILFISLESFRAKNVGCLGAKLPLSPHFDELAKKGILFSNFHSPGNLTNRSIIASLFGIPPADYPWHLGQYCDLQLNGLPHLLSKHGYHPAVIQGSSTAFDHEAEFFEKQGFKTVLGKRDIQAPGTSWGVYDEYLMPFAAEWLEHQKEPAFLNLYTITNHHPWIHPQGKNGYLNTFAYTDWALHLFIEELKKRNLLEKSILFIYGDHGQELEDRTPHFEINRHLTQDTLHVPLLIYAEGRIKFPQKIETLSSQIDLLPTVLDLLQIKEPHSSLGKSLFRPAYSPIFFSHPFDVPIRGCREGSWKYLIQEGKEELYDLNIDPEEKINRIEEGTPLREKTETFFTALDELYSSRPYEKKKGKLHLDFSDSLQLTDTALIEILSNHPHLSSLYLNHCLLLTDEGIRSALQYCPRLEKLYLDGIEDITTNGWPKLAYLTHLNALNCSQIKGDWIAELPSLRILQLGSADFKDEDLFKIASTQKHLSAICFSDLDQITDQGMKYLLTENRHLEVLSLSSCPQITKASLDMIQSKIFRYQFIS